MTNRDICSKENKHDYNKENLEELPYTSQVNFLSKMTCKLKWKVKKIKIVSRARGEYSE